MHLIRVENSDTKRVSLFFAHSVLLCYNAHLVKFIGEVTSTVDGNDIIKCCSFSSFIYLRSVSIALMLFLALIYCYCYKLFCRVNSVAWLS